MHSTYLKRLTNISLGSVICIDLNEYLWLLTVRSVIFSSKRVSNKMVTRGVIREITPISGLHFILSATDHLTFHGPTKDDKQHNR